MALDTSIAMQVQAPANPLAQYAQLAQLQNMQTQGKMADLQVQGVQRAQERQNKLSQLLSGDYATPDAREQALLRGGFADESLKLGKDRRENTKLQTDTEATQFKTAHDKLSSTLNILASAKDPASYTQAIQAITAMGGDVSRAPPQFDPAFVANAGRMVLTEKERLEQAARSRGLDIQALSQQEAGRHNRVSEGIAGGNLAVAREGLGLRKQELGSGGKPPSGYRWAADGKSLEAIPGGPAGKENATEGERKAATLLKRLEGSESQLQAALTKNPGAAKPGLVASGLRSVGAESAANTLATGSERQRVEAAQLDILDAALTLGTGAAYTKEQLEGYRKSYFPQIGDTPDNIKDKTARLNNVISAAKIAAGRAGPKATGVTGDFPQPASNIDALLDKYK